MAFKSPNFSSSRRGSALRASRRRSTRTLGVMIQAYVPPYIIRVCS